MKDQCRLLHPAGPRPTDGKRVFPSEEGSEIASFPSHVIPHARMKVLAVVANPVNKKITKHPYHSICGYFKGRRG